MTTQNQPQKLLTQDILEKHGIPCKRVAPIGFGLNDTFIVDDKYVIKLGPERVMLKEHAIYEVLKQQEIPLPRLVATGKYLDQYYLVTEKLEGQPLDECYKQLSLNDCLSLAWQVGFSLACIQEVKVDSLFDCPYIHQYTQSDWISRFTRAVQRAEGLFESGVLEQFRTYIAQESWRVGVDFEPVLVHADMWERHLFAKLIDSEWKLCGIIDFTDVFIDPGEYDLAYGVYWIREIAGGTTALLSGYRSGGGKLQPGFVGRLRLYQVMKVPVRILYWIEKHGDGNLRRALETMWPDALQSMFRP